MGGMNPLSRISSRHPVLSYSLARIVLFLVAFGLAYAVGVNTFWALVLGLVVSMVASFFLLSKQRDAISANVVERSARAKARMAERTAAEDAWDDAARTSAESPPSADGERESEQ
jgi:uncharacterized membrane protein